MPFGLNEIHTSGGVNCSIVFNFHFFFSIFKFYTALRTPRFRNNRNKEVYLTNRIHVGVCLFSISINLLASYHECRSLIILAALLAIYSVIDSNVTVCTCLKNDGRFLALSKIFEVSVKRIYVKF